MTGLNSRSLRTGGTGNPRTVISGIVPGRCKVCTSHLLEKPAKSFTFWSPHTSINLGAEALYRESAVIAIAATSRLQVFVVSLGNDPVLLHLLMRLHDGRMPLSLVQRHIYAGKVADIVLREGVEEHHPGGSL